MFGWDEAWSEIWPRGSLRWSIAAARAREEVERSAPGEELQLLESFHIESLPPPFSAGVHIYQQTNTSFSGLL